MTLNPDWQQAAVSLDTGLEILEITATGAQQQQLLHFLQLLQRWNRIGNLTAVTAPEQMVYRHLLDSISTLPWLSGQRVLDIGSGAGMPGIPLAIMASDTTFVLLDSQHKRTRFLAQVVAELGLKNVGIVTARVEKYQPDEKFDTLTARAFAPLPRLLQCCERLCAVQGRVMALKSRLYDNELQQLPVGWQLDTKIILAVPGLAAARHLLLLTHSLTDETVREQRTYCVKADFRQ
ncbi:MAG TPA: 16S rRNA (guanine(527)-N(7))-methyltransferase RsmG [Gammaproteobacteria bacterium]|nr:16S rRNA (guanine(527)-N(7))-methyltransferase RsmG [Gammaproteobacteria bacterium]